MSDHLFAEISKLDWQCRLWQTTHYIIVTRIELDLRIIIMNLNTKSHLSKSKPCQEKERKLQIIEIFRRPQNRIWPRYCLTNLYTKFHFSKSNHRKLNERKIGGSTGSRKAIFPSLFEAGGGGDIITYLLYAVTHFITSNL